METNHSAKPLVDVAEVWPITVVFIQTPSLTDTQSITAVAHEVRAVSRRTESPNILLDFCRVEHLSIDFAGEMKGVAEEIEMRGGTVACCSLKKEMRAVLEILRLNVFYAGHSAQQALKRYSTHLEKLNQATTKAAASKRHFVPWKGAMPW